MKLEAGFYKIREKGMMLGKCHYLKVFVQGEKKWYKLDNLPPAACDSYGLVPIEDIKFEKRLARPLDIKKVKIIFKWEDIDGDDFEVTFRDIQLFKSLFEDFPELAKAAGAYRKVKIIKGPTQNS